MELIIQLSYLLAAVLFILGLKQMSSPVTARRGIHWAGAGMVVLAGAWSGRHAALVELKLAALEGGSLHAGAADGPVLKPAALPYAFPSDAP
jgi:NAD/NADP transhydrogenase beta subunit